MGWPSSWALGFRAAAIDLPAVLNDMNASHITPPWAAAVRTDDEFVSTTASKARFVLMGWRSAAPMHGNGAGHHRTENAVMHIHRPSERYGGLINIVLSHNVSQGERSR